MNAAHTDAYPTGHLHWILGPVGAGKSTVAIDQARTHRAVRMNMDEWTATLFRGDPRGDDRMAWHEERVERCLEQIWRLTLQIADAGGNVVLELGMIRRQQRAPFLRQLDGSGLASTLYVVDAPRALRRERVAQRNQQQGQTYAMTVPPHVFELASDLWEPLDEQECLGRQVHYIDGAAARARGPR